MKTYENQENIAGLERQKVRIWGKISGLGATCISPPGTYHALVNARLPFMDIDFGIKSHIKSKDLWTSDIKNHIKSKDSWTSDIKNHIEIKNVWTSDIINPFQNNDDNDNYNNNYKENHIKQCKII